MARWPDEPFNLHHENSMRLVSIEKPISISELEELAAQRFGDLVKAVVDLHRELIVVDAELHADQEAWLLEEGSDQSHLWGINLYPSIPDDGFVEFDSMINLRPSWGNRSRGVDDPGIRELIRSLVDRLVVR
jgi:hypothetical protein